MAVFESPCSYTLLWKFRVLMLHQQATSTMIVEEGGTNHQTRPRRLFQRLCGRRAEKNNTEAGNLLVSLPKTFSRPSESIRTVGTSFMSSSHLSTFSLRRNSVLAITPPVPEPEPLSYKLTKHKDEELGYFQFHHESLQDAQETARQTKKPIFCVEAEIPGDTDAGRDIFSHPLIIEAALSFFVTVHCRNVERKVYTRSPSMKCCRTRVSFLDESGSEMVPCLCGDALHRAGVVTAMVSALEEAQVTVPKYLLLLKEEETGRMQVAASGEVQPKDQIATFGMEDSAVGEVEFAGVEGVLATRAGYIDRQRIVKVTYDSRHLPYCSLVRCALKHKIGNVIYYQTNDERIAAQVEVSRMQESSQVLEFRNTIQLDYDPKRALRRTPLRFVPLTDLQATRANRLVHYGKFNEAVHLLSPKQGMIFMEALRMAAQKPFHEVVDVAIMPAWISVCERRHPRQQEQAPQPQELDEEDSDGDQYRYMYDRR